MSAQGEIYVEVDAGVVNSGIMPLAGSGQIGEEGDAGQVVVWLYWEYDANGGGFTGKNWYWNDPDNPLKENWTTYGPTEYEKSENGFNQWLQETNPENLDQYLGNWDSQNKAVFCARYSYELGIGGMGCIEYKGY